MLFHLFPHISAANHTAAIGNLAQFQARGESLDKETRRAASAQDKLQVWNHQRTISPLSVALAPPLL